VYAQDERKTFLGTIHHRSKPNSIFNIDNLYGNEFSPSSIWNKNSIYGNQISRYSSSNPLAIRPPIIVKNEKPIGYISNNLDLNTAITGYYLLMLCSQFVQQ
jgi:hypothetical protein